MLVRNPIARTTAYDPFPQRMKCSLRYTDTYSLATDATGPTQNKFGTATAIVLNSLFAPVSGGHQPMYFDQITPMYNRYKVHAVDLRIVVEPALYDAAASNVVQEFAMLILPPGVSSTIGGSTVAVVNEKPGCGFVTITPGSGNSCQNIQQHIDISEWVGLTKSQFEADVEDYAALVSASPARTLTLEFATANLSNTTSSGSRISVEAVFHCEFFERKIPTQS